MTPASKPSVCPPTHAVGMVTAGMGPLDSPEVPEIVLHPEQVLRQAFQTGASVSHNRRRCPEK